MSQSLSCLWTHIIFSTKNRKPFLNDEKIRTQLYQYIIGISRSLNSQICRINGTEDHIHLLVNISKNISLSEYIKTIKKSSSKWLKNISSQNKQLSYFYWQSGYAAFSVSKSSVMAVKSYIKNQEQHHKKFDYLSELKKMLIAHNIEFNEIYLNK